MIDVEALVSAVQGAVDSGRRLAPEPLRFDSPPARTILPKENNFAAVLAALKAQPDLAGLARRLQGRGSYAMATSIEMLADWLICRAAVVGASQSVTELADYAHAGRFQVLEVLALNGIVPEHEVDLEDGLRLVPFPQVPECRQKDLLLAKRPDRLAPMINDAPSAALLRETQWVSHSEEWPSDLGSRAEELQDASYIISVIGPCAPAAIISWGIIPASVPLADSEVAWMKPFSPGEVLHVTALDSGQLQSLPPLWNAFKNLHPEDKEHLRIALDRLITSLRRGREVDRAIDLGICLESLFLNDVKDELTFRMQVRASRYLGSDAEARTRISDLVGKLYKLRSQAVHTGRLKGTGISETLKMGTELAATGVQKMIMEGLPVWRTVETT